MRILVIWAIFELFCIRLACFSQFKLWMFTVFFFVWKGTEKSIFHYFFNAFFDQKFVRATKKGFCFWNQRKWELQSVQLGMLESRCCLCVPLCHRVLLWGLEVETGREEKKIVLNRKCIYVMYKKMYICMIRPLLYMFSLWLEYIFVNVRTRTDKEKSHRMMKLAGNVKTRVWPEYVNLEGLKETDWSAMFIMPIAKSDILFVFAARHSNREHWDEWCLKAIEYAYLKKNDRPLNAIKPVMRYSDSLMMRHCWLFVLCFSFFLAMLDYSLYC